MYTLIFVVFVAVLFGVCGFLTARNIYKNKEREHERNDNRL